MGQSEKYSGKLNQERSRRRAELRMEMIYNINVASTWGPRSSGQQRVVRCTCTRWQALEGGTGRRQWQRLKKNCSAHLPSVDPEIISERRQISVPYFSRKASEVMVRRGEMKGTVWSF